MDRRDFIKLTAVTGTSATLASCGNPEHQLIRFVPDDELVPGVAEWKPSVCPLCRAGCGLTVRVMEAEAEVVRNGQQGVVKIAAAKKLEGQANHPINQGGLCPRGQAAIQITYHPDRLTQPMKRTGARGTGGFTPVSWDEAIAELLTHLDQTAAANDQASVACLTRPRHSRRLELFAAFLKGFGAPAPLTFELFDDDVLRRANTLSFGRDQLPTVDMASARYLIAFGADLLGTWNSPVAQNAAYGRMRRGPSQVRGTLVQVEPRMSQTGANADHWVPVKTGTEGVLALGLAHVILANKLRPADAAGRAGAQIDGWSAGLASYTPELVEKVTGVAARRIDRLAREFAEHRPAVAVIGGAPLAQTNGLFHALAVNALNALVGSVGVEGGMLFMPRGGPRPSAVGFQQALGARPSALDSVKLLLIDDVNPVFATPKAWGVRAKLERIPFIASFGSFLDETSVLADLILPDHSFLESWTDSLPESGAGIGVANAAGPVMRPLHDTRSTPDVLLDVAGQLKKPVSLPWKTFDEMLKNAFDRMSPDAWGTVQQQGWVQAPSAAEPPAATRPASREPAKFVEPTFDGDRGAYPFHFLPYASQALLDGSVAHLPWLQELPDPLTSAMWSSWVEINPATAQQLNIAQGDLVDVTSTQGTLRVPAMMSPGITPDVIAMPVGQGHDTFTRYASKRGANPIGIIAPVAEPETGALAWAATRVKIARAGDPDGSLIMFAGEMREHPHEHETR
jgi:menaquinone reductase, molybdopterin-binding-like subunit